MAARASSCVPSSARVATSRFSAGFCLANRRPLLALPSSPLMISGHDRGNRRPSSAAMRHSLEVPVGAWSIRPDGPEESRGVTARLSRPLRAPALPAQSCCWGEAEQKRRAEWLAVFCSSEGGEAPSELAERRERRRNQQLVLLLDRSHAGLRRPLPTLAGLLPDTRALGGILVDPHVHELVEPAELARPAGRERRELLAPGHRLAPRVQHFRDVPGRVRVDPHLVEVPGAEVAA